MRLNMQLLGLLQKAPVYTARSLNHTRFLSSTPQRLSDTNRDSNNSSESPSAADTANQQQQQPEDQQKQQQQQQQPAKAKSVSETDAELREKLEHMSGEGGAAGIEYEDGQPQTLKRSVRNNMFRYI